MTIKIEIEIEQATYDHFASIDMRGWTVAEIIAETLDGWAAFALDGERPAQLDDDIPF